MVFNTAFQLRPLASSVWSREPLHTAPLFVGGFPPPSALDKAAPTSATPSSTFPPPERFDGSADALDARQVMVRTRTKRAYAPAYRKVFCGPSSTATWSTTGFLPSAPRVEKLTETRPGGREKPAHWPVPKREPHAQNVQANWSQRSAPRR